MKALSIIFVLIYMNAHAQKAIELSQQLLEAVRYDEYEFDFMQQLAVLDPDDLANELNTDVKRKTFWINIYNATVQFSLKRDTIQYNDRMAFYRKKAITIAGEVLSPNDIEHGILRRSQWIYGLGHIRSWFPGSFEKQMRVKTLDPRIHFALNCGASGCPPILFYETTKLDRQLDLATKSFLQLNTRIVDDELIVSKLFSWYRGDFGSRKDVIQFLVDYHILADPPGFKSFTYDEYDWTLQLDMYK